MVEEEKELVTEWQSPLEEGLEEGIPPNKIRELPLGHRDGLAAHIGLEVALADIREQPTEAVLHIALAPPERVGQTQHPRGEEQPPTQHLDGESKFPSATWIDWFSTSGDGLLALC